MSAVPAKIKYSAKPGEVLAYLWNVVHVHGLFFFAMSVCIITAQVFNVFGPVMMKRFVDQITTASPTSQNVTALAWTIATLIGLRLASGLSVRCSGYLSVKMQPRLTAKLEEAGLRGVLQHAYAFFSDEHMGSIVRRIGRLGDTYERIHSSFFWNILPSVSSVTLIIAWLAFTRPAAAVIVAFWIVLITIVNIVITRWKLSADEERSRAQSVATGLLADIITNAVTVKSFARESIESRAFHEDLQIRAKAEAEAWKRSEHGLTMSDFFSSFMNGSMLFLALFLWSRGQVTVGDFIMLQGFVIVLLEQIFFIGFAFRDFMRALADCSEIVGILKSPIKVRDLKNAKPLEVKKGAINFSRVKFSYAGKSVMSDFTLSIKSHEKVALVGPSGAGKSTIVKLLLRFYDLTNGSIKIDGQDISKVTQQTLRRNVSLVPQDPALFHRTLKANIAYGKPDASLAEVIAASKKAHCHEFISKLPLGYESLVGERGVKLSGGERQRVAIARAILADAPILVLDEATSSLDSESEMLIQDALHSLMQNKTVIVIAHRLSTIMDMDRIIVMQDGRIVDQGTHTELTAKVGKYQDLWHIQAGGFKE